MTDHPEIGRELKVSDLQPRTIVCVRRGDILATMWVVNVNPQNVSFWAGQLRAFFLARRTGPDLEDLADDKNRPLVIHEYLGEA